MNDVLLHSTKQEKRGDASSDESENELDDVSRNSRSYNEDDYPKGNSSVVCQNVVISQSGNRFQVKGVLKQPHVVIGADYSPGSVMTESTQGFLKPNGIGGIDTLEMANGLSDISFNQYNGGNSTNAAKTSDVHSKVQALGAIKSGIMFNPTTRVFRLQAKNVMYAFRVDDNRNLEHLYWGPVLPADDDLSYLTLANAVTMFDPLQEVSVAKILGLSELHSILHDEEELQEKWKIYTKAKDLPEDQLRSRRLENASWRLWTRERFKGGDLNRDLSDGTLMTALGARKEGDKTSSSVSSDHDPARFTTPTRNPARTIDAGAPVRTTEPRSESNIVSSPMKPPRSAVSPSAKKTLGFEERPSVIQGPDPKSSFQSQKHPNDLDSQDDTPPHLTALNSLPAGGDIGGGDRNTPGGAPQLLARATSMTHSNHMDSKWKSTADPASHLVDHNKSKGSFGQLQAFYQAFGQPGALQEQEMSMNWSKLDPEAIGKNTKLLELSDKGTGDYREPTFKVTYKDGSQVSPLRYRSHRIVKGKPSPQGHVPHIFVDRIDDATTLIIEMEDSVTKLTIEMYYTVMHNQQSIIRKHVVVNRTNALVRLESIMSCTVDFDADSYHLTMLSGGWARERQVVTRPLVDGLTQFKSSRGASSHQFNPFMAISPGKAPPDETGSIVYAFTLVYSGNFAAMAEISESRRLRVNMGINPESFTWTLDRFESFATPEVIMTFSNDGLGEISNDLHRLMRYNLMPSRWRDELCPVLLNTWEALYFNVSHECVIEIARAAAQANIEMLVLDDGWFGKRNDINSGLGDWYVNREKFPFGLDGLCREINSLGLKFGIWVEPEMVNYDSDLHREHPDWTLHVPTRGRTTGRNQFVLDFSRPEVRDYIYTKLCDLLSSCNIEYVKWDMNRHLTEVFSQEFPSERQGEIGHRFILGVYDVLGRVTQAFPDVLLETCSGGGGRFDAGMLFFSPQIWTSDNTDAVSRTMIQFGTSLVYPIRAMGSHVSAAPNHQTNRMTTLKTRAVVAMMGTFGFELDPRKWTEEDTEEIRSYIGVFKRFQRLINHGMFYRLWSPFETDSGAWMYVSEDRSEALVCAISICREVGRLNPLLKMRGLLPDALYAVNEILPGHLARNMNNGAIEYTAHPVFQFGRELRISGRMLMTAGIPVKFIFDTDSVCFQLERC